MNVGVDVPGNAVSFNETVSRVLDPGQQLTAEFTPKQRTATFHLPVLAVSKFPDSTYRVKTDGTTVFGTAPIPPTDVDDLDVTFIPPKEFTGSLEVQVTNAGANTRRYHVQALGWEVRE